MAVKNQLALKDINQLAANILALVESTNLQRRMGETRRRLVEEFITAKHMAQVMERIY